LGQSPWLIGLGARWKAGGLSWTAGFVENITQRSTQDFGIFLVATLSLPD
jgi:hypothetical protein